jgi:hypothetical protein
LLDECIALKSSTQNRQITGNSPPSQKHYPFDSGFCALQSQKKRDRSVVPSAGGWILTLQVRAARPSILGIIGVAMNDTERDVIILNSAWQAERK